jgi:enoyl-CoA hydratase
MNQPPANQMTIEFFNEFNNLVNKMRNMSDLKAIVISGKGRHFSSGANLEELLELTTKAEAVNEANGFSNSIDFSEKNARSFLFFEEAQIPVIAAIHGVCIGSAFELTLFCHFRFCENDAVLGLPEATFNLMPGLGGIRNISSLCGQSKAIELVLRGSTFGAGEAMQNHLIDLILPRRQVVEFSIAFAKRVMTNYQKQKAPLYLRQLHTNDPSIN